MEVAGRPQASAQFTGLLEDTRQRWRSASEDRETFWLEYLNSARSSARFEMASEEDPECSIDTLQPINSLQPASQRNARLPIFCLPDEIFCEIFRIFMEEHHQVSISARAQLSISHVCQRWRTIACNFGPLWNRINFSSSPELSKKMLKRSKNVPLHVYFRHKHYCWETESPYPESYILSRQAALSDALDHIARISSIDLYMPAEALESIALKHTRSAPSLRLLDIKSIDVCNLPQCFLGGQAPLLSTLRLQGCGLAYNSPLLRNVTSLYVSPRMDEATTLERRIFEALRYMPLLECLTLLMIRPDTPLDTQVAFLPNLRILKLSGLSCISIFNHVSFPPTTSVEIACYDWGESIVEQDWNAFWTSIARIMSPSFYPGESRTLKTVAVDGDDDGIATLRAWNSADMPCDFTFHTAPAPTPGISVVIEWQGAPEEAWEHGQEVSRIFSELLEAAFRALPMPALETLHLGAFPGRDYLHSDFLVDILEPHLLWSRNFRTLITRTEHCAEFILAASFHQPDGRSGLPFPALETLVLIEASCFVNNMDVALLGCLKSRAEKGMKLKKLVLLDCDFFCELADEIEEVVEEMIKDHL